MQRRKRYKSDSTVLESNFTIKLLPIEIISEIANYLVAEDVWSFAKAIQVEFPEMIWKQSLYNKDLKLEEMIPDLSFQDMVQLLTESGCQHCMESLRVKKVTWAFRTRVCKSCLEKYCTNSNNVDPLFHFLPKIMDSPNLCYYWNQDILTATRLYNYSKKSHEWDQFVEKCQKITCISNCIIGWQNDHQRLLRQERVRKLFLKRQDVYSRFEILHPHFNRVIFNDLPLVKKFLKSVKPINNRSWSRLIHNLQVEYGNVMVQMEQKEKQKQEKITNELLRKSTLLGYLQGDDSFNANDIESIMKSTEFQNAISTSQETIDDDFWTVFRLTLKYYRNLARHEMLLKQFDAIRSNFDQLVENETIRNIINSDFRSWDEIVPNLFKECANAAIKSEWRANRIYFQPDFSSGDFIKQIRKNVFISLINNDDELKGNAQFIQDSTVFQEAIKDTNSIITSTYWDSLKVNLAASIPKNE